MGQRILRINVISPPSFLRITLLLYLEDFNRVNSQARSLSLSLSWTMTCDRLKQLMWLAS